MVNGAGMTCEVLFDKAKVILGSRASRLTKSQVSAWMRFVEILERFRENLTNEAGPQTRRDVLSEREGCVKWTPEAPPR